MKVYRLTPSGSPCPPALVVHTSDNSLGRWYSYRASKAGVNSLTKTFDLYLRNTAGEKAMAIALHPGTVKTGLSKEFWDNVKEGKLFTPEDAAEKLLEVVKGFGGPRGGGDCVGIGRERRFCHKTRESWEGR